MQLDELKLATSSYLSLTCCPHRGEQKSSLCVELLLVLFKAGQTLRFKTSSFSLLHQLIIFRCFSFFPWMLTKMAAAPPLLPTEQNWSQNLDTTWAMEPRYGVPAHSPASLNRKQDSAVNHDGSAPVSFKSIIK